MKQKFIQDDLRKKSPELANLVGPDEYVYYCTYGKRLWTKFFKAATEKRILFYTQKGGGIVNEAPWSEVAAVGDLRTVNNSGVLFSSFEIQTLKEPLYANFGGDFPTAARFHREVLHALSLHNAGVRDIRAIIWSLNLEGDTTPSSA